MERNAFERLLQRIATETASYRAGDPWHLAGSALSTAAQEAQERVLSDPWIAEVVRANGSITSSDVSPGEVLKLMNLHERDITPASAMRVAKILRDIGWAKGKRHPTRGQLYQRPVTPATSVSNTGTADG